MDDLITSSTEDSELLFCNKQHCYTSYFDHTMELLEKIKKPGMTFHDRIGGEIVTIPLGLCPQGGNR
jgi:hypothetical protein